MHRVHRIGWFGFILSAVLFTWAGWRAGDWITVAASLVFGLACVLFLVVEPD